MDCWTDYPIAELGDEPGKPAPVRPCKVLCWDGDKYATIEVEGVRTEVKAGYLYTAPGRCGDVRPIDTALLPVGQAA
jgi:hypothetical protein